MIRGFAAIILVCVVAYAAGALSGGRTVAGAPLAQTPRDTPTFTPTATATPRPPATFTPTHTPTPTYTPTPPPTHTPTPTPPATATPGVPPSPRPEPPAQPAPSAHLALSLTADPTSPAAQGKVIYTIQVMNDGNAQAEGVIVACDVPGDLKVLSATASQGTATVSGNKVTAQIGSLPAGQTARVTVQTQLKSTVGAGVPVSLTASATADGGLSAISAPVVVQIPAVPNTGSGVTVVLLAAGLILAALVLLVRGLQMRRET